MNPLVRRHCQGDILLGERDGYTESLGVLIHFFLSDERFLVCETAEYFHQTNKVILLLVMLKIFI